MVLFKVVIHTLFNSLSIITIIIRSHELTTGNAVAYILAHLNKYFKCSCNCTVLNIYQNVVKKLFVNVYVCKFSTLRMCI